MTIPATQGCPGDSLERSIGEAPATWEASTWGYCCRSYGVPKGSKVGKGLRNAGMRRRRRGGGRRWGARLTTSMSSSPRAIQARVTAALAPGESSTLPGLPPDGAGSHTPLASAEALIKRTICLPLNQTQIPFPSNVPRASRDPGGPSRLHLLSQGPGSASSSPLWLGSGVQEVGGRQRLEPGLAKQVTRTACWALSTRLPGSLCPPSTPFPHCGGLKGPPRQ